MHVYDEKSQQWIKLSETGEYKKKKKMVRDAWIGVGLVMLTLPTPAVFVLALLSAFMSFMFLDESEYSYAQQRD